MRFKIIPNDEGFMVTLYGQDESAVIMSVYGFATHEAAQAFVSDCFIKLAMAMRRLS